MRNVLLFDTSCCVMHSSSSQYPPFIPLGVCSYCDAPRLVVLGRNCRCLLSFKWYSHAGPSVKNIYMDIWIKQNKRAYVRCNIKSVTGSRKPISHTLVARFPSHADCSGEGKQCTREAGAHTCTPRIVAEGEDGVFSFCLTVRADRQRAKQNEVNQTFTTLCRCGNDTTKGQRNAILRCTVFLMSQSGKS